MTVGEIIQLLAALGIFLPILAKCWLDIRSERTKNDADRKLLNTMAGANRRRSMTVAMQSGMIVRTLSGYALTDKGRALLAPIKPALIDWYSREGHTLRSDELFWGIEDELGDVIAEKLCYPNGLHNLECLAIASLLCRETQVVGSR